MKFIPEPTILALRISVAKLRETVIRLEEEQTYKAVERNAALDNVARSEGRYELLLAEREAIRSNDVVGLNTWKQVQNIIFQYKISLTDSRLKLASITSNVNQIDRDLRSANAAMCKLQKRLDETAGIVLDFTLEVPDGI